MKVYEIIKNGEIVKQKPLNKKDCEKKEIIVSEGANKQFCLFQDN